MAPPSLRWAAIPEGKDQVFAHGRLDISQGHGVRQDLRAADGRAPIPAVRRRLETRLLVCDSAGGVYGVVYKWRPDNSDADLLTAGRTEAIRDQERPAGEVRAANLVLPEPAGLSGLPQREHQRRAWPEGAADEPHIHLSVRGRRTTRLRAWNHIGMFAPEIDEADLATLPTLAAADDAARSLQDRARSYLDANCSQCHRPGGTVAYFDARYNTPLEKQELIDGPVLIDQGIDRPRVISPHDIWRSIAYHAGEHGRMTSRCRRWRARPSIDNGVKLLQDWIESLPGRAVLDPPAMSPKGGTFGGPVEVSLSEREPGADIRYTLDGSVPGPSRSCATRSRSSSPNPAVLRARAYKDGFTRSITAQEVFIVGK